VGKVGVGHETLVRAVFPHVGRGEGLGVWVRRGGRGGGVSTTCRALCLSGSETTQNSIYMIGVVLDICTWGGSEPVGGPP